MVGMPKPIWVGIGTCFYLCAKMHMVGVSKPIWVGFDTRLIGTSFDLCAKMHMVRVPKPIWVGIGTHFDLCAKMHMVHVPIGVRKSIWLELALLSICASKCKWSDLALDFTAQPSRRVPLHLLQQSWTSTTPQPPCYTSFSS